MKLSDFERGAYQVGQVVGAKGATYEARKTEPPRRYTQSDLIDEMMAYDPTGHVGDRLMAMWIANEGLRLGGGSIEVVPGANARGR